MTTVPAVDLGDIQGLILRGYAMPALRVFVLQVGNSRGARQVLRQLVEPATEGSPAVTTAAGRGSLRTV